MPHLPGHTNQQSPFGSLTSFGPNSLNAPGFGDLGGTGGLPGFSGLPGLQDASGQQQDGLFSQIGNVLGSDNFSSGLGAFSTLANMYTGFKSLGLAKDQFRFQKQAFNKNFNASAKAFENQLRDKWAANNASAAARGNTFQDMDKWLASRTIQGLSGPGSKPGNG